MTNYLKKPLGGALNDLAIRRAGDAIQKTGRSLPCTVTAVVNSGIVEVSFQVNAAPANLPRVIVPVELPEYIRIPIQVGMKGKVNAADALLGGMTGLGAGTPTLNTPLNLTALSFTPLGNTGWTPTDDPDAVVVYGPNGVVLRDAGATNKVVLTPDGIAVAGTKLGFFATAPASKPTVTGALSAVTDGNAKAVLTSIIGALTTLGLVTDGTS